MLKNIETTEKVIIQKMVQLPVDIAAEVLTCYCYKIKGRCVLLVDNNEESCPFNGKECLSITREDWEEYLNG